MSIFQIILLFTTLVMAARQVVLIGNLNRLYSHYRAVRIKWSWWAHLIVTIGLIVATVLSFTGVSA